MADFWDNLRSAANAVLISIGRASSSGANAEEALEQLGEHLNVSRLYIMTSRRTRNECVNAFEWCSPDVKPAVHGFESLGLDGVSNDAPLGLSVDGDSLVCPDTEKLPSALRRAAKARGARAMLLQSVRSNGSVCGVVGFDDCSDRRDWLPLEAQALRSISAVIGGESNLYSAVKKGSAASTITDYSAFISFFPGSASIISESDRGRQVIINDAFASAIGQPTRDVEKIIEKDLFHYVHPDDRELLRIEYDQLKKGETDRLNIICRIKRPDGSIIWVNQLLNAISRESDNSIVYFSVYTDITDNRLAEEELRIRGEENEIVIRQSGKRILRYDLRARLFSRYQSIFRGEDFFISPEDMLSRGIIPEESLDTFNDLFRDIHSGKAEGSKDIKVHTPDGFKWFHIDYTLVFDANGEATHAIISMQDITERYEKELAYISWQSTIAALISECAMYMEVDLTLDLIEKVERLGVAEAIESQTSFSDYISHHLFGFTFEEDAKNYRDFFDIIRLLALFTSGTKEDSFEYRATLAGPEQRWYHVDVKMMINPYSNNVKAFIIHTNIDRSRRELERLAALAARDSLTGLLNREATEQRIKELLANAESGDISALFMIDLDDFKQVNDRYGHQMGDNVLRRVSSVMSEVFRSEDIVGRTGGDEFMVFLPKKASLPLVRTKAAALIDSLQFAAGELTISACVGISLCNSGEKTFEQLYSEADIALYHAKSSGKICFKIAKGSAAEAPEEASGDAIAIQLKTLFEYMDGGIILLNVADDFDITYISPSIYKSFDLDESKYKNNAKGLFSLIYPGDLEGLVAALRGVAEKGGVTDHVTRTGIAGRHWLHIRAAQLPVPGGAGASLIAVISDVTALMLADEQLKFEERRYRTALKVMGGLVWEVDIKSRTMTQSKDVSMALGLDSERFDNMPEGFIATGAVFSGSAAEYRRMFHDIFSGTEGDEYIFRMSDGKGGFDWVRASFRIMRDDGGLPLYAIGVTERITNVDAQMNNFEQELHFSELLEDSILGALRVNLSHDTIDHSTVEFPAASPVGRNSYSGLLGYIAESICDIDNRRLFLEKMSIESLTASFKKGAAYTSHEFLYNNADRVFWVCVIVNLLRHPVSGDLHMFVYLRDIAKRKRWEEAISVPVTHDPYTSFYSKATLKSIADSLLSSSRDSQNVCSLTVVELAGMSRLGVEKGAQAVGNIWYTLGRIFNISIGGDTIIGRLSDNRIAVFRADAGSRDILNNRISTLRSRLDPILRKLHNEDGIDVYFGFTTEAVASANYDKMLNKAILASKAARQWAANPVAGYVDLDNSAESDAPEIGANLTERATLLIADDDPSARAILCKLLGDVYNVVTAENGGQALELLRQKPPVSLLLLDLNMPVVGGFEVLELMNADSMLPDIPVIVVTASDDVESIVKALDSGATDVITKPYQPMIVRSRIHNTIIRSKAAKIAEQNRVYELRFQQQANLLNMLENDELTGLHSKQGFYRLVREALDSNPDEGYVILRCDLDRFKVFNDVFGTRAGDKLLRDIGAECMKYKKDPESILARFDADHFVFFFRASSEILNDAICHIEYWLSVYPINFNLTASMGIYDIDDPSVDVSLMCDRALLALRTVKDNYGVKVARYDDHLRQSLLAEHLLVGDMVAAITNEQFEVYYQPQVDYTTGSLIGSEALVRWNHPERGLLMPGDFIPLFESNGSISALSEYVWERCCRQLRAWIDRDGFALPVSVNISRLDLYNTNLCSIIKALVDKYSLPVSLLKLEITESAYMDDAQLLLAAVQSLRGAGFTVEIDDFGSGYSSLNTLKDIVVDVIKLDMRFLSDCADSSRSGNIISSIIRMARWLGLPVLAEGVETKEQADYLVSIGCLLMQGYYFGRPMPLSDYEKLLSAERLDGTGSEYDQQRDAVSLFTSSLENVMLLNSMIDGAVIMERRGSEVEFLRCNDRYLALTGWNRVDYSEHMTHPLDDLNAESRARYIEVLDTINDVGDEGETTVVFVTPKHDRSAAFRCRLRMLGKSGDGNILLMLVEKKKA